MARPIRIEHPGAWYHVTARGNERRPIYLDDHDRNHFCEVLGEGVETFGLLLHGYVLMDNHYHLLIETPQSNLSRSMQ
jgi:putative transposase